jgi:hypothetical protein
MSEIIPHAWADIGGLRENMTWTYVMISATF